MGEENDAVAEKYINELTTEEKKKLKGKKIVAIDPNMSDLLYCIDNDVKKEANKFRYTQNQRRKETKSKIYKKILEKKKKKTKINGQTVKELETELSRLNHNHKTVNFENFKVSIYINIYYYLLFNFYLFIFFNLFFSIYFLHFIISSHHIYQKSYLIAKNALNFKLAQFYGQECFRKYRFISYIRKQKTDSKLLKNFREKFGSKDDVVICFGDWEQSNFNKKYHEPVKGKGFRNFFRKAG